MRTITIRAENEKVSLIIDSVLLQNIHSFSIDYIRGVPLLFSCVADMGDKPEKERKKSPFVS